MGWFTLLVCPRGGYSGNGRTLTVWGWDRADAVNRARADGYVVLAVQPEPSTTTS